MAVLDQKSLDTGTPRTTDGRTYPPHLRRYEPYDALLLHLLSTIQPATFDQLSVKVENPRARAVLSRWLASAEWRGLVERRSPSETSPLTFLLTDRGAARLATA